jgi:hypothetical protein
MISPGAATPSKIIGQDLFLICTSTQCDLSFYQVSLKSPKEFWRSYEELKGIVPLQRGTTLHLHSAIKSFFPSTVMFFTGSTQYL